jgi:hypothetical protein
MTGSRVTDGPRPGPIGQPSDGGELVMMALILLGLSLVDIFWWLWR